MTTIPVPPTGRREVRDGAAYVAYTRTFAAPIEDVWAAVTEPDRLARWIGTWSGDPASGEVAFRMTAEGEDVPEERFRIDVCEPPRRLVTRSWTGEGPEATVWRLELDLAEHEGKTTLTFAQAVDDPEEAASTGPGWDYYLDRLVAAESGRDVAEVVWDDYYPAQSGFYRAEFS